MTPASPGHPRRCNSTDGRRMILRKLCAAAVCILAMSGAAHAQSQGEAEKGSQKQQNSQPEHPKSQETQPAVSLPLVEPQSAEQSLPQTKVYEADCRQPKSHDDADLCVQRRVAGAAEDTYQLTRLQTLIGALGLAFVVVTLGFTAWTGKAASIAAQAAVDAVNSERAWMIYRVNSVSGSDRITHEGKDYGRGYIIDHEIANMGRTPAINCFSFSVWKIEPLGSAIEKFQIPDRPPDVGRAIVGPGAHINAEKILLVEPQLSDLIAGRAQIKFYSLTEYHTLSNPGFKRRTVHCSKMIFTGFVDHPSGKNLPSFASMLVGEENAAT